MGSFVELFKCKKKMNYVIHDHSNDLKTFKLDKVLRNYHETLRGAKYTFVRNNTCPFFIKINHTRLKMTGMVSKSKFYWFSRTEQEN